MGMVLGQGWATTVELMFWCGSGGDIGWGDGDGVGFGSLIVVVFGGGLCSRVGDGGSTGWTRWWWMTMK